MDAQTGSNTFGQALGELILQKRRAAGLTQIQLAEDAYGTGKKTRRISELESGKVANPHPATIDPIISVLKITESEIEQCAKRATTSPKTDALDEAYRNARNLIEAAAKQFEHSRPDASLAELDEFLRRKAKEWRELRDRLFAIEADESEIEAITKEAEEALSTGSLNRVDELLATAEETLQKEHTLKAIEKQASLRIARGDAALLGENPVIALEHYRAAAKYFEAFDEQKVVETLHSLAGRVYEGSLRSLEPRFFVAAELLDDLSKLDTIQSDPEQIAKLNYRRGLVHLNAARKSHDEERSLDVAVEFARSAAKAPRGAVDEFQSVCAHVGFANALLERGGRRKCIADIDDAITSLRTARVITKEAPQAAPMAPHVLNSLGAAILARRKLEPEKRSELRDEALTEFEQAVVESQEYSIPDVWGAAKVNVARMLAERARDANLSDTQRIFLRIRAIAEYQAGIETFPVTFFPDRFADAKFELAGVLFEHAMTLDGELAEVYLGRAIQSYQMAAQVFDLDREPYRWAAIHMYVASAFVHHAHLETAFDKSFDFQQAVDCYQEAARTFAKLGATDEASKCENAIKKLFEETEAAGIELSLPQDVTDVTGVNPVRWASPAFGSGRVSRRGLGRLLARRPAHSVALRATSRLLRSRSPALGSSRFPTTGLLWSKLIDEQAPPPSITQPPSPIR